jgi:hypothetical protein
MRKAHQPLVTDYIEESRDVGVHYPVHLRAGNPDRQSVQRIVLTASRSEPVREPQEIFFVDCIQHLHHSALNDLIFQRGDPQRALPPIGFWDVAPS